MARKSTRDMIIGVAAGLFATNGLRRTTMETIATAAGRGRRTVYMYFTNKAEIYDAVVDMEIKLITGPLRDTVSVAKDFETVLHRYGDLRVNRIYSLMSRNPLLLKDFSQGHSRVERLRERLNNEELQILTPLFRRVTGTGSVSSRHSHAEQVGSESAAGKPSPEEYATIFLNMLRGSDRLLTKTDGLPEAIRLSSVSADIVLRGFVKHRKGIA
jgi:AcrR family transcriptional regulator